MAAPDMRRRLRRVVIGEIVLRDMDRKASLQIAEIFIGKRAAVLFRMAGDEKLPPVAPSSHVDTCFF